MADTAAERLLTAFELHSFGVRIYRQRLRLEQPERTDDEIDAAVDAWLQHRPGAEHGDGVGVPSRRFG
ncbi:MAG: hypothetical protein ACRDRP_02945 [Pseudonocardiaceae bacterium]